MVKLTIDMMLQSNKSNQSNQKRDGSVTKLLKKKTHLNLENKHLSEIGKEISACPNLLVLYLYDNDLTAIPDLSKNPQIEAIYLQNNKLSRIENIDKLLNLKKLYLGHNDIYLLEGLENANLLEELHVESQKIPPGDSLIIDPFSANAFSKSLRILNVSGNNLTSVTPFEVCFNLRNGNFSNNLITDLEETKTVIAKNWFYVEKLDFSKNPISTKHKYRDEIILSALNTLEILDEKEITPVTKQFLKGLKKNVETKTAEENAKIAKNASKEKLADFTAQHDKNRPNCSDKLEEVKFLSRTNSSSLSPSLSHHHHHHHHHQNSHNHQPERNGLSNCNITPNLDSDNERLGVSQESELSRQKARNNSTNEHQNNFSVNTVNSDYSRNNCDGKVVNCNYDDDDGVDCGDDDDDDDDDMVAVANKSDEIFGDGDDIKEEKQEDKTANNDDHCSSKRNRAGFDEHYGRIVGAGGDNENTNTDRTDRSKGVLKNSRVNVPTSAGSARKSRPQQRVSVAKSCADVQSEED